MKSGWQILISALWRKPVATLDKAAGSLRQWFDSPLGQDILSREFPLIDSLREGHKGDVNLIASAAGPTVIPKAGQAQLEISIYPGLRSLRMDAQTDKGTLVTHLDELPLPDHSVDFVLLHHVLEFSENPHDVLREAVRVLAPRGHLLVVGFNPWSAFGIRASIERLFRLSVPWAHHRLSSTRLTDWLYLMSCEPSSVARGFYTLPAQSGWVRRLFGFTEPLASKAALPGGGFYMIHATKNLFGRMNRGKEITRPQLVPFQVASPAARVVHLRTRKTDR